MLNPHWVTGGIYTLLNSDALAKRKGELAPSDLGKELNRKTYPKKMHEFLLDLMEKFELCFHFLKGDRYLIPELLDSQEPKAAADYDREKCLNFQYHYPVIPPGLLPRFIVRTHVLSEKYRWRTGVILHFEGNDALVKADPQDKKVFISITGPVAGRRRMLAVIRQEFDHIHGEIPNLNPAEMVPLPGYSHVAVAYRELEVRERNNSNAIWQQVIGNEVVDFKVRELLNGIDLDPLIPAMLREERPLTVFYSYAHLDAKQRSRLEKHLAPLNRLRLITDWCDNLIHAGDEWEAEIAGKLNEADIVLLLVSPDFVWSSYCYEKELKAAMQRHEAGEAAVIPIIIRPTHAWPQLPFGKLNALPTLGKPIPKWPTHDDGWANVAQGVEAVAKKLLERRRTH